MGKLSGVPLLFAMTPTCCLKSNPPSFGTAVKVGHWLHLLQVAGSAEVANNLSKEDSEALLAQMVYTGILQIEFGFTAYATNAYLKCSQRAAQTLAGLADPVVCNLCMLASNCQSVLIVAYTV